MLYNENYRYAHKKTSTTSIYLPGAVSFTTEMVCGIDMISWNSLG